MELIRIIRDNLENYSPSEAVIAEAILRDTAGFSLKSVGDMAGVLGFSKTTLIRFAKKLGFSGYAEFRHVLQEEVVLERTPLDKLDNPLPVSLNTRLERLKEMEYANISRTLDQINPDALERLVSRVTETDFIYTLGWGVSYHLADLFSLRLSMLGKKVIPLRRENIALPERAVHLREGDLLLTFEFPRYSREVLDTAGIAYDRKAEIHLFTDSRSCPIDRLAECSFYCSSMADAYGNSLIGPISLINMVTNEIWLRLRDGAAADLKAMGEILNNPSYYIP